MSLSEDRWVEQAVTFNLAPVQYIHDSWLETLPDGDLVRALASERRAAPSLSRHLLESFDLADAFFDDFAAPRARLALLDNQLLERIFLYAGLALRSAEFRNEIDGARIARLREALGTQAMDFAVRQVPLLGTLPVFDYEPDIRDTRARLTLIGAVFSLSRAAWSQPAYAGRVALKLPHGFSKDLLAPWPQGGGSDGNDELPPIIRRLIKEFGPEWQPLFA